MTKTLKTKNKSNAVQNEIDRNEDMIRSCLRALVKIQGIEGADSCAALAAFVEEVPKSEQFVERYNAVKAEAGGAR